MKNISITLETLADGTLRATGRREGATGTFLDGHYAPFMIARVLAEVAPEHMLPSGGFDMTHIELNDAAAAVLYPRERVSETPAAPTNENLTKAHDSYAFFIHELRDAHSDAIKGEDRFTEAYLTDLLEDAVKLEARVRRAATAAGIDIDSKP